MHFGDIILYSFLFALFNLIFTWVFRVFFIRLIFKTIKKKVSETMEEVKKGVANIGKESM